jgi:hypothetical protein
MEAEEVKRLHDAAEEGTAAEVEALLASGCNVDAVDEVRRAWITGWVLRKRHRNWKAHAA